MRKRYALLLALVLFLMPQIASACTEYILIVYQTTEWWDGTTTTIILDMEYYDDCSGGSGGTGGDGGSGGSGGPVDPTPIPPTVSILNINTSNPNDAIVSADVASNDPADPVNEVTLEVNGTTVDYTNWGNYSFAQIALHLGGIGTFSDGSPTLTVRACSATGVCATDSATMTRFTPSPSAASTTIFAQWLEEDEGDEHLGIIYVPRSSNYGHVLGQSYTTTNFTCSEVGENSHYEIKNSLVTLSGNDPMPVWTGAVSANGTTGFYTSWSLTDSAIPYACTFPTICSAKAGGVVGAFGYAPSVHETISSFSVEGQPTYFSNGSLDISFP
jgi:hypothetical protein